MILFIKRRYFELDILNFESEKCLNSFSTNKEEAIDLSIVSFRELIKIKILVTLNIKNKI
jgi:hypothetical protein